jgi:uncharacterized protein (DUF305 family)
MRIVTALISAALLAATSGSGSAQVEHQQQHHGQTPQAQAETAPATPNAGMGMMEDMPNQCRVMTQGMPRECVDAMQKMMQGGMMEGASEQGGGATGVIADPATQAYVEAMDRMHGPMMEGLRERDPDVAFVRGMIPHHQGAIDMARVVKRYGDDEETQQWAEEIIKAQEREISEMKAWLKKNAR